MIELEQWNSDAALMLQTALPGKSLKFIQDEVARGVSQLWHAYDEKSDCYIVTRLEEPAHEWVGVAIAGIGAAHWVKAFVAIAKEKGLTARIHVIDEAHRRLWSRLGFRHSETVLRAA